MEGRRYSLLEWIPVEERLPKVGVLALVSDCHFTDVGSLNDDGDWDTEFAFIDPDGVCFWAEFYEFSVDRTVGIENLSKKLHDAEEKIQKLTAENERLKIEGTRQRIQLYYLQEDKQKATDKATARSFIVNGTGQCFCPNCHACVWEPPNIPAYWRRCQYANKEPPRYCPRCGQRVQFASHLEAAPQSYEEDPLKNNIKETQKNGTWYHRR